MLDGGQLFRGLIVFLDVVVMARVASQVAHNFEGQGNESREEAIETFGCHV
jgi:hypothetical protein